MFTTAATATIIFLAGHLTDWSRTAAERREEDEADERDVAIAPPPRPLIGES